jgi:hypothetical protein
LIDQGATAAYDGDALAIVEHNGQTTKATDGHSHFQFDFGRQTFDGTVSFQANGNRWEASVAGDGVRPDGFSANHVQSGPNSDITHIGGTLQGGFYGPNAEAIGGHFRFASDQGIATGVFGASQTPNVPGQ